MSIAPEVEASIAAIRGDQTHGASWLSREAMRAMARCAERSSATDAASLLEDVRACIDALVEARPEMAPIRHWMERLVKAVDDAGRDEGDVHALRLAISATATRLIALAETANRRAAENAVARLPASSGVFTPRYSPTAVHARRPAGPSGELPRPPIAPSAAPR